jgi:hypothetical protein
MERPGRRTRPLLRPGLEKKRGPRDAGPSPW